MAGVGSRRGRYKARVVGRVKAVEARDVGRRIGSHVGQEVVNAEMRGAAARAEMLVGLEGQVGGVSILSGEAVVNVGSIGTDSGVSVTISVVGALVVGTPAVVVSPSVTYSSSLVISHARVSAADTVTVVLRNTSEVSSVNPGSHTMRAVVFQY